MSSGVTVCAEEIEIWQSRWGGECRVREDKNAGGLEVWDERGDGIEVEIIIGWVGNDNAKLLV